MSASDDLLSNFWSLGLWPCEDRSLCALWYANKIWYPVQLGIGSAYMYVVAVEVVKDKQITFTRCRLHRDVAGLICKYLTG